jgi:hypothetical protein
MKNYYETILTCLCGRPAEYAHSVPDSTVAGLNHSECGYKIIPACFSCSMRLREQNTDRHWPLLRCELQGIGRVDFGVAGGGAVCEYCGYDYYHHLRDLDYPFMTVLCDGSAVKL